MKFIGRVRAVALFIAMFSLLNLVACHEGVNKTDDEMTVDTTILETTAEATDSETTAEATDGETTAEATDNETTAEATDSETTADENNENGEREEVGLDITSKTDLVSICYSVWFDGILGTGDEPITDFYNISEVLAGNQEWGNVGQFHYWSKPAQGYYRSTDKSAARNNMTLLGEAGVDFIILDYTNANDSYVSDADFGNVWAFAPLRTLCEVITEMRAEGKKTPYIVLWCGKSDGPLINAFYEQFYTVEEWADCFVYWDGKPFMITAADTELFPCPERFTIRKMWGLTDEKCWKFLSTNNRLTGYYFNDGKYEQLSVAVATQESYMSAPTAHGRDGGKFFYRQWKNAFTVHPKVVTVTWWNEWAAQRFIVDGETAFVDNYTQEYSRDIEPMEGGHGDQYYQWLKQYIAAYKSGQKCPQLYVEEN